MFKTNRAEPHQIIHESPRHRREQLRRQRLMLVGGCALILVAGVSLLAMLSFFG